METKMKRGSKIVSGNLLISPDGIVVLYCDGVDLLNPNSFCGTPEEFIVDQGRDVTDWEDVSSSNPYGSYEENCNLHALGMIDMDDPNTY